MGNESREVRWPRELLVTAGFVSAVAGCLLASLALPPGDPTGRVVLLAISLGVFATWAVDPLAVLATAGMGWSFATGFLVNQHGELALTGWPDLWRLALLMTAGAIGIGWGRLRELVRQGARRAAPERRRRPRGAPYGPLILQRAMHRSRSGSPPAA